MIKLIAFDWNGTLLADTKTTLNSSNKSFVRYGLKPITIHEFRKTFTIPIIKFWQKNGLEKNINFFKQSILFHNDYNQDANFTRTRSGAKLILEWLQKNHIQSIIFSNHISPEITKQLIRLNIFQYFNNILARSIDDHSHVLQKSKDKKLNELVSKLKIRPFEIMLVGDTEEEIEIGKKFGYYTVAITGGYNTTARLKKHHPDFLIHNLKDLIPIIKKINSHSYGPV